MFTDIVLHLDNMMKEQADKLGMHLVKAKKTKKGIEVGKLLFSRDMMSRSQKSMHHIMIDSYKSKSMHHQSKLTQVQFKIFKENRRVIVIPLEYIKQADAHMLSELMFIMKMCRKYHVPFVLCSLAKTMFQIITPHQAKAIAAVLGASTEQQRDCLARASILFNDNL